MRLKYRAALEAQLALMELNKLTLPIKTSLAIARLSNLIDSEMQVFVKIRDKLVRDYSIIPTHTDKEDIMSFSCSVEGENTTESHQLQEKQLREFVSKFDELLNTETPEWDIKVKLPQDIVFKPKLLKALANFLEVE